MARYMLNEAGERVVIDENTGSGRVDRRTECNNGNSLSEFSTPRVDSDNYNIYTGQGNYNNYSSTKKKHSFKKVIMILIFCYLLSGFKCMVDEYMKNVKDYFISVVQEMDDLRNGKFYN